MNEDAMRKAFEAWAASEYGAHAWRHTGDTSGEWSAWQAATRAAVPDGWKIVPMEPTPTMISEARYGLGSCIGSCGEASPPDASDIADALRSAIEAAPEVHP